MSTPTPPPNQPQWQQPHTPSTQRPQPPYQGPSQPPYGQQPGAVAFAPAPPPKKRHGLSFWLLIGALVIVALIFVSCTAALVGGAGSGSAAPATSSTQASTQASDDPTDTENDDPTEKPTQKAEPKAAGIGDSVKAGDWSFKVTSFECGKTRVGDQYAGKKAQGQFCFLKLTAKNNGDSEGTLSGDSQKLSDDNGKEYSSDLEASLYEDSDSLLFLEGVNPGNTAKGTVIFDVPKSAKPTEVSLTGGLFSGSVKVSLG